MRAHIRQDVRQGVFKLTDFIDLAEWECKHALKNLKKKGSQKHEKRSQTCRWYKYLATTGGEVLKRV